MKVWLAGLALMGIATATVAEARTLDFAGRRWTVRPNGVGGPRNNRWCQANAFVDAQGRLHLRLTKTARGWCSAEVSSTDRMGFGHYRWTLDTRVDRFDKNVVLGLFNYPPSDVGGDGTNEIDIEFARWGKARWDPLNYTVFPRDPKVSNTTIAYPLSLAGERSTHSFRLELAHHPVPRVRGGGHRHAPARLDVQARPAPACDPASAATRLHEPCGWLRRPPTDSRWR